MIENFKLHVFGVVADTLNFSKALRRSCIFFSPLTPHK